MATKSDFSTAEWQKLLESVLVSGMAVSAAEPSGLWGLLKEGMATARAMADVKADKTADPLVTAIVNDLGTSEGRTLAQQGLRDMFAGGDYAAVKTRSINTLKETAALLDTKAPGDADQVKAWLRDVSARVAEAASEGGFMGFGGTQVSEAEKTTLDEISNALGLKEAHPHVG
jgi:hypothetical protein